MLGALHRAGFPVPRPLCYARDASIIGTEFYVMEHVQVRGHVLAAYARTTCSDGDGDGVPHRVTDDSAWQGRIFRDASLPGLAPEERRAVYAAMAATLADLHKLRADAIGLGSFGRRERYYERQLATWTRQYRASETGAPDPAMEKLLAWLSAHVPADEPPCVVVHGDFRIDNMVFDLTEPRIVAVLDWELCTLGHPLADLAHSCMMYDLPSAVSADAPVLRGLAGTNLAALGIPAEADYVAAYCARVGTEPPPAPAWRFHKAFALFRLAAISQGVYSRALQGNASSPSAANAGSAAAVLARIALGIIAAGEGASQPAAGVPAPVLGERTMRCAALCARLERFMEAHVMPAEREYRDFMAARCGSARWSAAPPCMEVLKERARAEGLWNLFLPAVSGLTQLEYASLAEIMGRSLIAPEAFNCSAPGPSRHCRRRGMWRPLDAPHGAHRRLRQHGGAAHVRDGGAATDLAGAPAARRDSIVFRHDGARGPRDADCAPPARARAHRDAAAGAQVASSDATNIRCAIRRSDDGGLLVSGRKWWISGAGHPRCRLALVLGVIEQGPDAAPRPPHRRHTLLLVPFDAPGVRRIRPLHVFGYDDAPHGHWELEFCNVRVPASHIVLGEDRGFEIAQGRLGPGRLHHCMRLIGLAERALGDLCRRVAAREAFGRPLAHHGTILADIAASRADIDQARLLCLHAAHLLDTVGAKQARQAIALIKAVAPAAALRVLDRAIQAHGAAGLCEDYTLAAHWAAARALRIADGPDEVHRAAIARAELRGRL